MKKICTKDIPTYGFALGLIKLDVEILLALQIYSFYVFASLKDILLSYMFALFIYASIFFNKISIKKVYYNENL